MNIKVIVGLGNKGKQYENTYHNIGRLALGYFQSLQADLGNVKLIIPESYMNNIGLEIARVLSKSGLKIDECLIVHDDSDLNIGKYKISQGGGSAGHKGLESIIQTLKSSEFLRLRIGIRPEKEAVRRKAEEFVLSVIKNSEKKEFEKVFQQAWQEITPQLNQS